VVVVSKCVVYGKWTEPSGWNILKGDERINGSVVGTNSDFFVREYSTYEDARKWVVTELSLRRKNLGRAMNDWMQRVHIK
jgi:hypothetical protein